MVITASLGAAGLAACAQAASPVTGSPASVLPVASGSVTPVMAPPATGLPAIRNSPPGPPVTGRSLLTEADSGMTIVLPAGQEVTVVLGPPGMAMPWDRPVAQGGAVVRVSASGGYPSSLPARAVFKAARPGTARLTSWTDARCLHLPQPRRCLPAQQMWEVTVVVPAG